MSVIDGIRAQHDGKHMAQPCLVPGFECDAQILLWEVNRLREELEIVADWLDEHFSGSDVQMRVRQALEAEA